MHDQPLNNRRGFYRIKDRASLEIRPFSENTTLVTDLFQLPPHYQLITEFQLMETEAQHLLSSIQEKDRNVAAYLKIINRKLDSLCRTMAFSNYPVSPDSLLDIDLSEGGLSFVWPTGFPAETSLGIRLILLPSCTSLLLKGRVLRCIPLETGYDIHLEFPDLDDHQRQLIARHILRRQQEERRQRADL